MAKWKNASAALKPLEFGGFEVLRAVPALAQGRVVGLTLWFRDPIGSGLSLSPLKSADLGPLAVHLRALASAPPGADADVTPIRTAFAEVFLGGVSAASGLTLTAASGAVVGSIPLTREMAHAAADRLDRWAVEWVDYETKKGR